MILKWLFAGLLALAGGLGVLQSAVWLQSYALLLAGVALAAGGTVLMVRERPAIAAA